VSGTGVADEDLPGSDGMIASAVGRASIHRVTVVDTLADCVSFNDLDTHDDDESGLIRSLNADFNCA